MSFRLMPFESLGAVSYLPSVLTQEMNTTLPEY